MNTTITAVSKKSDKTQGMGDFSLGGFEYLGLQDYKRILLRNKWLIILVALFVGLGAAIGVYYYPNSYKASTVIMVDPEKVPRSYVMSTATISASERLVLLQQQILSNPRLSQVIDELGLYSDLRKKESPDEIVLQMKRDTHIDPVTFGDRRELEAFTISFVSRDPQIAAKVTNRLASLFIEENMKSREEQVMGTSDFFDRELEKAKEDMTAKGKKMEGLRSHYFAQLPESQNAHVQALASLQLEMRAEMDAISRAQQQKVYLQSLMANTPPVVDLDSVNNATPEASASQQELARLQSELEQARTRYGPEFPDVVKLTSDIKKLQAQVTQEQKSATSSPAAARPLVEHHNPVIESQIAQLDQEIQKHTDRQKDLQTQIAFHQSAIEASPAILQQLDNATRDYQTAEEDYKRLQDHKFAADISSDIETRQKGERFVIIEPAQPPASPVEPNRPLVDGVGLLVGLLIGVGLVFARELVDGSVKTKKEVTQQLPVPVFAEIPWMDTPESLRRSAWSVALQASGSTVLALAYCAMLVFGRR